MITPLLLFALAAAFDDPAPTYERDVKALLAKRCTVCHNARKLDKEEISGGLALDTYDAVLRGAKGRASVMPGQAGKSELLKRLSDPDEDTRMPLLDQPLGDPEQALIRRWVDAGAPRGEAVTVVASTPKWPRRLARTLDVVLPLDAKVPPKIKGLEPGGALQLALKVGPLPSVTALAFRGDGRLLAVGTHGAVVLWDVVDGRPAIVLAGIVGPVHALAFTRDGRRLAVGSGLPARSGIIRVYDVPGGALLQEFEGHDDVVVGLAFRPDDGQLASASYDGTVRFWDLILGRAAGVFRGHSDFVYDVAYDREGKSVFSVSKDRGVKRIDTAKSKERLTYSDHNDDILALAVAPEGGRFVTAGNEPQLRWWKADEDKPKQRNGGHGGPVFQLAFSGNGAKLISASGDGTVRLWEGRTGGSLKTLTAPGAREWQYAAALSGDATVAAAGGWDGVVHVWDADSGKLRVTLLQPPGDTPDATEWLAAAPSGFVAASPALKKLIRWRVGGTEVSPSAAEVVFSRPDALAHALRGETVMPVFK